MTYLKQNPKKFIHLCSPDLIRVLPVHKRRDKEKTKAKLGCKEQKDHKLTAEVTLGKYKLNREAKKRNFSMPINYN